MCKAVAWCTGIMVNQTDNHGINALCLASHEGKDECVKLLLGAPGIMVNQANNDGITALCLASHEGKDE